MSDLKQRELKMQERRKHTPFREFVGEIASRTALNLYKNQGMISRYPVSPRVNKITSIQEYNKVGNQMNLIEHNPALSFFDNFKNLRQKFTFSATLHFYENQNSDFADCVFGGKNGYLSFVAGDTFDNVLYSAFVYTHCHNVLNSVLVSNKTSNVYYSKGVEQSFNIFYSKYINNCSNLWFCTNCTGCQECLFCDGLENVSYHIKNKKYEKGEYLVQKEKLLREKHTFTQAYENLTNIGVNYGSTNVTGNFIRFSENVENSNMVMRLRDSKNCLFVSGVNGCSNFYDCIDVGIDSNDFYGCCGAGSNASNFYCCTQVDGGSNLYYSYHMSKCSYCLGCIGLKNQQFCIFNKQYNKDERYQKVNEIFAQMDKDGTLGKFFPPSMNPFYFNDTPAYLVDSSFTKEEATTLGYLRRDEAIKTDIPQGSELIEIKDLASYQGFDAQGKRQITSDILKKVIRDEKGNYYRIVKTEYDFLMKHGLPLPELHRLERIKLGFKFK